MPRSIALILTLLFLPSFLYAQSLEDALRVSTMPLPSGSRGLAMGGNLISSASGYDALDYNPAAIAPLASSDFGISFFNRDHRSTAQFFGQTSDAALTQTSLSSIGLAAPYPTVRGHLAMGISFDRVRDYTSTYSFKAINPNSSLFNTQGFVLDQGNLLGGSNREYLANNNLAYALGLTYDVPDSGAFTLTTPFRGGLEQSGTVSETGSLNAVRIGAGIDIAPGVSAGATLNLLFGTYDYSRDYRETDVNGIFANDIDTVAPSQFKTAEIIDAVHQDQSGGSLKLGLLVSSLDIVRFGLTVETPTILHIDETSSRTGSATFGGAGTYSFLDQNNATTYQQSYDIQTPLRIGAGASLHMLGMVASASVSYVDMSQIQFTNSDVDMSALNQMAHDSLRGVLSWQVGAEYVIPVVGLSVRAGFSDEPSSFKGDPSSYDTKAISAGIGVPIGKSVVLEGSYRHITYHTSHAIYNDLNIDGTPASANIGDDAISRNDIAVSFNYLF
jgi:hypothetical protein